MPEEPFDLVLIGCGLRGTGLLTAVPELMDRRMAIIEASDALGPGSFAEYEIESNSSGSDFFGWVAADGPFGDVLQHPDVRALRSMPGNFRLALLARALRHAGAAIARRLPPEHVLLRERVVRIDAGGAGERGAAFALMLASGKRLAARTLVLATGIRETPRAELAPWRNKTLLSSRLVRPGGAALLDSGDGPLVIVGGSHSGYSVAMQLHDAMLAGAAPRREVVLIHRSPVKLFYASRAELDAATHPALEAVPDPDRDVCPESGNIFRYSGLRHGAKALFRAAAAGDVPWLRQVRVRELAEATPWLDGASAIVQAMGYESNTLPLFWRGDALWHGRERLVVQPAADGTIPPPDARLFVMGMDPYPYRDNSLTPTGQYALRGKQILKVLHA